MRELEHKQKVKRRLYSTPVLVAGAIVTLLIVRGAFGVMFKERQSRTDMTALQAKVLALRDEEKKLSTEIDKLNTKAGIEEEIKQKFNVSAEGEQVAVIIDPTSNGSSTATTTEAWYKRLWGAILSAI